LKTDIETNAPDAVREKLGLEKPKTDTALKLVASPSSLPSDMDAIMQKTGHVPAPPAGPG
jgi:O-glycosyl hydrolase